MERFAERSRDVAAAVPAQLDDGRLLAGEPQRGRKPGGGAAGMEDEIAFGRRRVRAREARTERARELGARGAMSTTVTSRARQPRAQIGDQQADQSAADDGDAVGGAGAPSHTALSAVSMLAASTARAGGTPSGTGNTAAAGSVNTL